MVTYGNIDGAISSQEKPNTWSTTYYKIHQLNNIDCISVTKSNQNLEMKEKIVCTNYDPQRHFMVERHTTVK